MICPKCEKDVRTVYGEGEYPNSDYRCSECIDDEIGKMVLGGLVIIGVVLGGLAIIGVVVFSCLALVLWS